jgi:hypothetical protein
MPNPIREDQLKTSPRGRAEDEVSKEIRAGILMLTKFKGDRPVALDIPRRIKPEVLAARVSRIKNDPAIRTRLPKGKTVGVREVQGGGYALVLVNSRVRAGSGPQRGRRT